MVLEHARAMGHLPACCAVPCLERCVVCGDGAHMVTRRGRPLLACARGGRPKASQPCSRCAPAACLLGSRPRALRRIALVCAREGAEDGCMVARARSECARRAYGARTRPPEGQGASFPFDSCFQVPTARAWCAQAPRALGDVEATGSLWGARLMPSGGEGLRGADRGDARRAGGGGTRTSRRWHASGVCLRRPHLRPCIGRVSRPRQLRGRMALCLWLRTARVVYLRPLPSLPSPSLLLFFSLLPPPLSPFHPQPRLL